MFQTGTNEGWGITYYPDTDSFIVSDGSNNLYFWDAITLKETSMISVTWQNGSPRDKLNELEYDPFTGCILANVWFSDYIIGIDPKTGVIKKYIDLAFIWPKAERQRSAVLNGISTTDVMGEYLLTGKLWPNIFRVKFEF